MEKHRPAYALEDVRLAFASTDKLRLTRTAHRSARALGLRDGDIVEIIQSLQQRQFYKSMTTYGDCRIWQDVYHAEYEGLVLYVKLMIDDEGYLIVSLKEK